VTECVNWNVDRSLQPSTDKSACRKRFPRLASTVDGFGRAVRRIREEQKINQEEAAERCGLHRTYYSGVERGVRNVSLVNIEKIARGLKRSLPELFGRV
jgi:DNA-binding XRE family transcriptional regulator